MSANVSIGTNSIRVMREAMRLEELAGCQNYVEGPGVKLAILPDEATVADVLRAIDSLRLVPPAPLPPTA